MGRFDELKARNEEPGQQKQPEIDMERLTSKMIEMHQATQTQLHIIIMLLIICIIMLFKVANKL